MFKLYDLEMKEIPYPKGLIPLDIFVSSLQKNRYTQDIQGRNGVVDYGFDYTDRDVDLTMWIKSYDTIDYRLLRNEVYAFFGTYDRFYIEETNVPSRVLLVAVDDKYIPDRIQDNRTHAEIKVKCRTLDQVFWMSKYTTLDLQDSKYNSEFSRYGLVDNINDEQINYRVKKEDLNLLSSTDLSVVNAIKSTNNYLVDGTVTFEVANTVSGIAIKATSLKPNTSYTLKYDYQKVSGTLVGFGGHMDSTWSNAFVSGRVDNKAIINYQGVTSAYIADDNNKHTVILHFKTGETVDITHNIYIQPNRLKSDQVEVKVSNLTLVEGDSETQNWSHSILDFRKVYNPKITSQKFSIYNAGNVTVEAEGMMYLKIFIMGLTTNDKPFTIRNKTTNEEFILNKAGVGNNLLIDGVSVTLNNVNVLRDTNFNFIKLERGLNEFEIIGGIYSGLYFDFRFYYK